MSFMATFSILSIGYDGPLLDSRNSILRSNGFRVARARNRHEAVMLCGAGPFDLVLLCNSIPPADAKRLHRDIEIMRPRVSIFNFAIWDEIGLPRDPEPLLRAVQGVFNRRNGQRSPSQHGELQDIPRRQRQRVQQPEPWQGV